ncbi:MAG: hypothetical protein M3O71_26495 [Bacteroidota bacterium]|nr:hypothetical protein [Bacteroidota bacterium]
MKTQSEKEDWWDELPPKIKQGISDSLEQANRGEFISIEEVKQAVNILLKKND